MTKEYNNLMEPLINSMIRETKNRPVEHGILNLGFLPSPTLEQQCRSSVVEWSVIAMKHYGINFPFPKVSFSPDLGYSADGVEQTAIARGFTIQFSLRHLYEAPELYIGAIVPHEVAHCVCTYFYSGPCGHDHRWEKVMSVFGLDNSYAAFDPDNAKPLPVFTARCKCAVFQASHKTKILMAQGKKYYCNACDHEIHVDT